MNRILLLLSLVAVSSVAALSQVQVLNSASLQPGLPSGGALATIFFTIPPFTFTPGTFAAPPSGPLPFALGGVEVRVNDAPAPLIAVEIPAPEKSPYGRVDFQVPMARNGSIPFGGFLHNPGSVDQGVLQIGKVNPDGNFGGVYVLNELPPAALGGFYSDGHGYASAQHASDNSFVTLDNPAHSGETIIAFADDVYDVWPPIPIGLPTPEEPSYRYEPRVTSAFYPYKYLYLQGYPGTGIGTGNGSHATTPPLQITFQGLATGQIGVEEIHFIVPADQAPGDWALFFHSQLPSRPVIENGGVSSPYVLLPVR